MNDGVRDTGIVNEGEVDPMIPNTPQRRRLVILPGLRIKESYGGKFLLTKKFISGVNQYLNLWAGPVCVLGQKSRSRDNNLDHIEVSHGDLPFETRIFSMNRSNLTSLLKEDDVLLLSLEPNQCFIPELPEFKKLVKVYISEYSLKTRKQMVFCDTNNPLKVAKRVLREWCHELRFRRAVALADGIQCNGTPTYEAYKVINKNALLFYDTRVFAEMLATEETILRRTMNKPIRLLYSGRLIKIKGADHLIDVANHLVKLGVNFEMTICGGGALENTLKQRIDALDLSKKIKMAGVLDFNSELVPLVKKHTDLFVCCHRQGDPSCTYLETLSCGVPIIGYDNEAFRGIVEESQCGWLTPMGHPEIMARKIAQLSQDRAGIVEHSRASLRFAQRHTFEKTFERRIGQLKEIAMKPGKQRTHPRLTVKNTCIERSQY
jgi:colanic acid/amylovoran biosynthesis glycosyltransferase